MSRDVTWDVLKHYREIVTPFASANTIQILHSMHNLMGDGLLIKKYYKGIYFVLFDLFLCNRPFHSFSFKKTKSRNWKPQNGNGIVRKAELKWWIKNIFYK